jgi:beta-glucanase (GH16 family)
MKKLNTSIFKGICAVLMLFQFSANAQTTVFQDDFNSINTANWTFETGGGGWGNNEKQYYQSANAAIVNGELVITARKQSVGGLPYTSARMKTQGKKFFTYGHMEARAKFPVGQGLWPAIWMLGENIASVGWPACGEIDILEHVNTDNLVYGTIHWDFNGHASYGGNTTVNTGAYNVYSIDWDANAIKWNVNGVKYHEANIANSVNGTEEFHRNFFFILNLAVAGDWPGQTVDESKLPATLNIDYVKVTQGGTPPVTGVATTFKDCNYAGTAVGLAVGDYNLAAMNSRGILNDDISSLRVTSGYKVTLYENDNFTGASLVVTADNSCLVGAGWNDRTTSMRVATNTTTSFSAKVEAENYISMAGVQTEACSEGTLNVGWIEAGDWMAYNVTIPTTGTYRVIYRVASPNAGKTLRLEKDNGATQLGTVTIPNTGGWQNWTNVAHNVTLPAGTYPIGIATATGGFNINYFTITNNLSARSVEEAIELGQEVKVVSSPNPFMGSTKINVNLPEAGYTEVNVLSSVGTRVSNLHKGHLEAGQHEFDFNAESMPSGLYIYTVNHNGKRLTGKLIKK